MYCMLFRSKRLIIVCGIPRPWTPNLKLHLLSVVFFFSTLTQIFCIREHHSFSARMTTEKWLTSLLRCTPINIVPVPLRFPWHEPSDDEWQIAPVLFSEFCFRPRYYTYITERLRCRISNPRVGKTKRQIEKLQSGKLVFSLFQDRNVFKNLSTLPFRCPISFVYRFFPFSSKLTYWLTHIPTIPARHSSLFRRRYIIRGIMCMVSICALAWGQRRRRRRRR